MSASEVRYELHYDAMEESYTIRRVEDIGPFDSREAARRYMIGTLDARKAVETQTSASAVPGSPFGV